MGHLLPPAMFLHMPVILSNVGWCVSRHAIGQAGSVYPRMQWGKQGVCIPECNRAGGTHPTGMHPCSL